MKSSIKSSNFLKDSLTKISPKNLFTPAVLIFSSLILVYSAIATKNINWGGDNRFFYLIITILCCSIVSFLLAYESILKSIQTNRWILGIVSIIIFGISFTMSLQAFDQINDGVYPKTIFYLLGGISLNFQIQTFLVNLKVFDRLNYLSVIYFTGFGLILEQAINDVFIFQNTTINFVEIVSMIGAIISLFIFIRKYREFIDFIKF